VVYIVGEAGVEWDNAKGWLLLLVLLLVLCHHCGEVVEE
jgi:hypothetical protein